MKRHGFFLTSFFPLIAFAPDDGGAGAGDGAGDGGGDSANDNQSGTFAASLTGEGYADFAKEQGWASADDAVKAYQAQQAATEGMVKVPGKDASEDEQKAFRGALGVPDKADGYDFKVPEKMPDGVAYDDALAGKFKEAAHKLGLTPAQAQGIHDMQMEHVGGLTENALKENAAQLSEKADKAHAALEEAWGKEGSQTYNKSRALAERAINMAGGDDLMAEMKENGYLSADGAVLSPMLAKAFAKFGEKLAGEDSLDSSGGGAGQNPYKPETFNMTKQIELQRNNPDKARQFILAAGENPKEYGL